MDTRIRQANYVINSLYRLVRVGVVSKAVYEYAKTLTVPEQKKLLQRYQRKSNINAAQLSKVRSQLRDINKVLKADQATHTWRLIAADIASGGGTGNDSKHTAVLGMDTATLESALSGLRYYDPAVPGTLVTAAAATGTYSKEFFIDKVSTTLTVRNNYNISTDVKIYACVPKEDTSIDPVTAFSNGMADQGNPTITEPELYLTDSDQFNRLWKIEKVISKRMHPGQEMSLTMSGGKFGYDPSLVDSHNLTYQKQYKGSSFVIRVQGTLGHDSTVTTERGLMKASVDYIVRRKVVIKYDAGVSLNDFTIDSSGLSTFTNGPQQSQRNVEQQGWER